MTPAPAEVLRQLGDRARDCRVDGADYEILTGRCAASSCLVLVIPDVLAHEAGEERGDIRCVSEDDRWAARGSVTFFHDELFFRKDVSEPATTVKSEKVVCLRLPAAGT